MARKQQATGITNAPLAREQSQQEKVPPQGESIIGKGRHRKQSPPAMRHAKLSPKTKAA